jgi:hypothetical protein
LFAERQYRFGRVGEQFLELVEEQQHFGCCLAALFDFPVGEDLLFFEVVPEGGFVFDEFVQEDRHGRLAAPDGLPAAHIGHGRAEFGGGVLVPGIESDAQGAVFALLLYFGDDAGIEQGAFAHARFAVQHGERLLPDFAAERLDVLVTPEKDGLLVRLEGLGAGVTG